jgi:GDSL-like Lipase/Acylhydrolase family
LPKPARKSGLWLLTGIVTIGVMLVLGEILIGLASPSEYLYPRYQFSAEYGLIPFANVVMLHGIPRKFEFHYTVNSMQSRGEVVEPRASGLPAVVVLGDSYSFGMGVADGDEFPTVIRRHLAGRADVVNLGEPGWGLTQEIRRYYAKGAPYDPKIVVLQFCANDPGDNLANRVTVVENGEFKYVDSANSLNFVKKYLSRSFVQRTQLYNFFRTRASRLVLDRMAQHEASKLDATAPDSAGTDAVPGIERTYIELLEPFAAHLDAEGRLLWVISVDHQLEQFPHIAAAVHELDERGDLRYIEVLDWLHGHEPYTSPEGHIWGAPAHALIGEHLAAEAAAVLADSSTTPGS